MPAKLVYRAVLSLSFWTAAAHAAGYQVPFDILTGGDIRLRANSDSASVRFYSESASTPAEGTTLHVFLSHSPNLDGDRSFVSIVLNYGLLRSIRLSEENAGVTEVIIPVHPSLLKRNNSLVFSVEQYSAGANGQVWTDIGRRSYLSVAAKDPQLDVSMLPAPLVDPYSYRPQAFDVLLPQRASTATMEATALIVANLARRAAPRPVDVRVVNRRTALGRPLLIAGTPEEQPGAAQAPKAGVTLDGTRLFVTGQTGNAVLQSAALVTGKSIATGEREWKGFIPPSSRFTLRDLGFDDLPFTARNGYALSIPVLAPPDCRFYPSGGTIDIDVQGRGVPGMQLDVTVNQSKLATLLLDDPSFSTRLAIPAGSLSAVNVLQLKLRGVTQDSGGGSPAALLASTRFYLPHEYESALPDLSLLASGFYPFSIAPDLSSTIILVPDRVDEHIFGMLISLSSALGQLVPASHLRFRVRRLSELSAENPSESNFIYLRRIRMDPPPEAVFPAWPSWQQTATRHSAVVQQAISGWNSSRVVMAFSVLPGDAAARLRGLLSADVLSNLRGDIAFIDRDHVSTHTIARKRTFRDVSYLRRIEAFFVTRWFALPIVVTLISVVMFAGLKIGLGSYRASLASGPRNPS